MTRALLLAACLWCSGCGAAQEDLVVGFPILPPVEGADSSIRAAQTIQVPTEVSLKRDQNRVAVSVDSCPVKEVRIDLGRNMLLGSETRITVLPEKEPRVFGYGGVPTGGWMTMVDVGPGAAEIELTIIIFETDIPAQHQWSPTSGKYRILGEWRLKGSIAAR